MRPACLTNCTLDVIDVKGALDASHLQVSNPYLVNYTLSSAATPNVQLNAQVNALAGAQGSGQSLYLVRPEQSSKPLLVGV